MDAGTTSLVAILRDARKSTLLRACESFDFCIFHMSQIKDLADPKMPKANRFTGSQDEVVGAIRTCDRFHSATSALRSSLPRSLLGRWSRSRICLGALKGGNWVA